MADNTATNPGSGGDVISTDDIGGGVKVQRVKVQHGVDGTATDVSTSSPMPVTIAAAATSIAKAEDAAHASGDVGVMALAVQKATPANLGADGDYGPLQVSAGRVWASSLVTDVVPGSGATNLGKADGVGFNAGDVGVGMLTVRRDTAQASASADRWQPPITDAEGLLWVRPAPVKVRLTATPTISNGAIYASGDQLGGLQTLAAARKSGGSGTINSITIADKTQAQRAAIDIFFFDRSITVPGDNAAINISDADMLFCLGWIAIAAGDYNTAFPGTPLNSIAVKRDVNIPFILSGSANLYAIAVVRGTPTYTSTTDLVFGYQIEQD